MHTCTKVGFTTELLSANGNMLSGVLPTELSNCRLLRKSELYIKWPYFVVPFVVSPHRVGSEDLDLGFNSLQGSIPNVLLSPSSPLRKCTELSSQCP